VRLRRIKIPPVIFTVLAALVSIGISPAGSGAITDVYAGGRGFSAGKSLAGKPRASDKLSRSIAHYTMGIIYDNESNPREAIREYEAVLRIDPGISYAHTRLAADHFLLKNTDKALSELSAAVALDPSDVRPRFLAGLIYTSLGKYDQAQKEYQEAVRLAPDSIWALSSLADLFVLQEKMAEAASVYEKLIASERSDPDEAGSEVLYFNLGVIYSRMGKSAEAMDAFRSAVKLNDRYPEAHIGLAILHEMNNGYDDAIRSYEKAISIDPANAGVYHHLGMALIRANRYDEAVKVYQTLSKIDPKDPYAYIEWANVYFLLKKPDDAIAVLRSGLGLPVKDADLYTMLGYAYSLKDKVHPEALRFYNMAVELKPDSPIAHFYLGTYYDALNNSELAKSRLREAIRLDPDYDDALNYLGYMLAQEGVDLDEAVGLIKRALEQDPENGAYLDSLGWAYYKKGMPEEALGLIERALEVMPGEPEIVRHLEEVKEKLKNKQPVSSVR